MKKIKIAKQYNGRTSDPDILPEKWILRAETHFNEQELLTMEAVYNEYEKLENKTSFKYNSDKFLIEKCVFLDEHDIGEKYNYNYNVSGQIVNEKLHYSDGSVSIKNYQYSESKTEIIITDEDGVFEGREIKIFNNNKQLIEHIIYDETETITEWFRYIYNDAGKMMERREISEDEKLIAYRKFVYDESGNIIEMTDLTPESEVISSRKSSYNENNQVVHEIVDDYLVNYFYNESGHRVRDEIINPKGDLESFTDYVYEDGHLSTSISCNKGNILSLDSNIKSSRTAFIVSRFDYIFY